MHRLNHARDRVDVKSRNERPTTAILCKPSNVLHHLYCVCILLERGVVRGYAPFVKSGVKVWGARRCLWRRASRCGPYGRRPGKILNRPKDSSATLPGDDMRGVILACGSRCLPHTASARCSSLPQADVAGLP
jgi:hypothetical protein